MSRDLTAVAGSGIALLGLLALALGRRALQRNAATEPIVRSSDPRGPVAGRRVAAAQRLNQSAGMLAASVLADSSIAHYRGSFHNRAMVAPLLTSSLSLLVSGHGNADDREAAHRLRDAVYAATALTGLVGTGFHLYNIGHKPGGFSWQNLFYSAPVGAPAALTLSGALGFMSERLRDPAAGRPPTLAGWPAGRVVAAVVAAGLLGTSAEVGLLHFRGAYQHRAMVLPVTIPPLTALALGHAALRRSGQPRPYTRFWLRLTAFLGFAGVGFHARGVARYMGGWRNWSQNLLDGPPLPAPPGFTGLALAGLAALSLMKDHRDE